jgi:hypothetical protein
MKNIPKLDDLFNIESAVEKDTEDVFAVSDRLNANKELDQEDDYQLARQTLRNLIVKGNVVLDDVASLAKNSEHPRAYEVTGQIIKNLSDVSKDLLNLQKQAKELKGQDPQNINTQNNIVFAGSTNDLLKLLNKKDDSDIIDQ